MVVGLAQLHGMRYCWHVVIAVGGWFQAICHRDENRSDTDGYHRYHICFHIFGQIQIQIRIMSTMLDKIRLDVDIINIRFKYSDMDTVSDVNIRTRIRTDLNLSKRIQSRIWSKNICTIFIPAYRWC